jgi:enoyl-CoA hydratase
MSPETPTGAAADEIGFRVRDGIGWITFNRPAARNALTFRMYEGLADLCRAADQDPALRVLVLTGAGGKAFAAGTDIAAFRDIRTAQDAVAYEHQIDRVLTTLETCRVPTIAAIAGACTGGGAAIAACCDLRIATAESRIGFPIARTLGNCLSAASLARVVALIGAPMTKEIIFTARLLNAGEAKVAGFLNEVVPDGEDLAGRAADLATLLAGHAPLTLRATKEALRRIAATAAASDDLVAMCYTSADFREGIESFLSKRPPRWTGT